MKFAMFFLLCCVAFVAAAPQFITYPGYVGPAIAPATGTVVAGPTVVNAAPGHWYGGAGLYGHWW